MSNITISLPDRVKSYIDAQVAQGGYASADEYFLALVLLDQQRRQAKESLDSLLIDGLNSLDQGKGIEATDDWMGEFLEFLRLRRNQAPKPPAISQISHPLSGLSREERIAKIQAAVGGWQDDPEIADIFAAIDRERHAYPGRAIATLDDG
ncbi:MAG: ribbon-helix-helix domain-containing protein [Nodosilinea sp.]|jgi:antitoxin ParD1/3/4